MSVRQFKLNLADIQMAAEMFDASPDGQAERERVQALVGSLPDVRIELNGYRVCGGGRCGRCYDCRESA